jgi:hypothetical protein
MGIPDCSEFSIACNRVAIALENINGEAWINAGKATRLRVCDCHVVLGHDSNLLYCGRSFLSLRISRPAVWRMMTSKASLSPDVFLYVVNFWHSVVSTGLLRDLASDRNDA